MDTGTSVRGMEQNLFVGGCSGLGLGGASDDTGEAVPCDIGVFS